MSGLGKGKAIEYINAGAPFIVCDIRTAKKKDVVRFTASKCVLQDNYFSITGQIDLKAGEGDMFSSITQFLGKKPVLTGFGISSRGVNTLRLLYEENGEEFSPSAILDIQELVREYFPKEKHDIKSIAEKLDVGVGLKNEGPGNVTALLRILNVLYFDYGLSIETPLVRVKVQEASYWKGPTKNLERVYVKTVPRTEAYYDIIKKTWVCRDTRVDLDSLVRDTVFMYDADSVNALCAALKAKKAMPQQGQQ